MTAAPVTTKTNASAPLHPASLDDKYTALAGRVLLNGNQALIRALVLQHELDRRVGLNTGGFVSGYRGSPIGGLDLQLWAASKHLERNNILFNPGVNEELAATAVWGTQQLAVMGDAKVDGVYAIWYGKGPGVDRCGDAFKHGNYSGTHPNGGVLVVCGDDHHAKSSTLAHHSQQALVAASIPTLYPADAAEIVSYALLGWAMSRYSGCWIGCKLVNETIEQTLTTDFDPEQHVIKIPDIGPLPPGGVHFQPPQNFNPVLEEANLRRYKLPLVKRFARANLIDRLVVGNAQARFGVVVAGKMWHDIRLALQMMGIDEARAQALGFAVYKVGMIWPLEDAGLLEFAQGKEELCFVEEKTSFVEAQAAEILYNTALHPRITGKTDGAGNALLPADVAVEPIELAGLLASRLKANGLWDKALQERVEATRSCHRALLAVAAPADVKRIPYFCSGCPHNTSTKVPEGSRAMAGIGCHAMAIWARPGTLTFSQMGGEGNNWVGMHHFTNRKHVFQNLGDGTYYHSGLLAIRGAVASGASITYKILYNDATAMTGGQPVDGPISVSAIAHQVANEGVKKIVLVTDDPRRHANTSLPAGVRIEHRDRLDAVQQELREIQGCTILLYEQTCAAEKRRRRKKGNFPDPDRRMFIYDAVCEGCGDCSTQSTCVSIEPKETEVGRKRLINQSTCNKDYSCVKGFCPSFVTVEGGKPKRPSAVSIPQALFDSMPLPAMTPLNDEAFGIMISGIGGTGVITVGAVLAMAAHLEGKAASVFDMTGLAQKNGAVHSHLQVADATARLKANKLGLGDARLALGFDMIAALSDEAFRTFDAKSTTFIGNNRVQPTAMLNMDPDARVDFSLLARKLGEKLPAERVKYVDATGLALALTGDSIASNFFLVGYALQLGVLPLSLESIQRAIELNNVQVKFNQRALNLGRLWAHNPESVTEALGKAAPLPAQAPVQSVQTVVESRVKFLTDYQDAAYALRYSALVERVRAVERKIAGSEGALSMAVAKYFAKLMAYKDEYEVARLYSLPDFRKKLDAEFDNIRSLRLNMAPPLFAKRDPETGRLRKREYGSWMLTAMGLLARFRSLRGSAFDIFGRSAERHMERGLISEYEQRITSLLGELTVERLAVAVKIAEVPEHIRGFGHVKEQHVERARASWQQLADELRASAGASAQEKLRASSYAN